MRTNQHFIFILIFTLFLGCDGVPDSTMDGGAGDGALLQDGMVKGDGGGPDSYVPLNLPAGNSGHSDVSATLDKTKARAGAVTTASQLLSGIKVEGKVGDFKIYNNKVAFIIQKPRTSDGWAPFGGELVDAMRLGQSGTAGHSLWGEAILGCGIQMLKPTSVGVINDGSDGKAAIVRVIGSPKLVPYLGDLLGQSFGGTLDVHMVMEYSLEPDSEVLQIKWRFFNATNRPMELPVGIIGLASGDGINFFTEGDGFTPQAFTKLDYVGMVGRHISYALASLDVPLTPLVKYTGVWVLSTNMLKVPAAGENSQTYYLALTGGEPEAVRKAMRALQKKSEPNAITGTVTDPAKKAVTAARVNVLKDDALKTYVTMTRTDSKGAYAMALPAGKYLFQVTADGREPVTAVPVTVGSAAMTKDLSMGGTGTIKYAVTDGASAAMPAKLVFTAKTTQKSVPSSFGEQKYPHSAAMVIYSPTGSGSVKLPPGDYTVHVSRGFEYEISTATVTVADSKEVTSNHKLTHSVDTTGYMCGDFHLHGMWSQDSDDLYEFKVSTLAASGVEIPVATDHEYIADYNPYINKLGLQKWIYGIVGEELTTLLYGHFNPFPITQDASQANMGAMKWFQKTPATLFADVRKAWPNAVFQVNHPRSPPIGGYFNFVGYDAATGVFKYKDQWSQNFDAFEVFNSDSWSLTKEEVQDWFSFLDRGFLVTGTANSDSHHAMNSEAGWPRNYVKLSTDIPANLSLSEFSKSVKAQKVLMSGGPFVTVSIGGKSMGEVADAKSGKVSLAIKVQAPTWMKMTTLQVVMGGKEVKKITLDSTTADPKNPVIRYNNTVELLPTADTHVVVAISGGSSLAPVSRGSAFAVTNPIYLDVDGNGVYDAPKAF